MAETTAEKQRGKPFRPGQSGNPNGRPPGVGQVARLRDAISEHVPEIIGKLVEMAKGGDAASARLLLERVLPPVKATEQGVQISIPHGSLTEQGRAVVAAAAEGDLSPGQAAQLLGGLSALAKLIETDELERRIEALEQKNGQTKQAP